MLSNALFSLVWAKTPSKSGRLKASTGMSGTQGCFTKGYFSVNLHLWCGLVLGEGLHTAKRSTKYKKVGKDAILLCTVHRGDGDVK